MARFQHDCDDCISLGTSEEFDLYFCDQCGTSTVIARFGDGGSEYLSGMHSALHQEKAGHTSDPLVLALRVARERGLITTD